MNTIGDNRLPEDIDDAAVRTLAEVYYECGFAPERAYRMAQAVAVLPERGEDW